MSLACHPGLWGRIQNKRRFEETRFVTTPCAGRGQGTIKNSSFIFFLKIFIEKITLILSVTNGSLLMDPGRRRELSLASLSLDPAPQARTTSCTKYIKTNFRIGL
jgi:hypothetical protein